MQMETRKQEKKKPVRGGNPVPSRTVRNVPGPGSKAPNSGTEWFAEAWRCDARCGMFADEKMIGRAIKGRGVGGYGG